MPSRSQPLRNPDSDVGRQVQAVDLQEDITRQQPGGVSFFENACGQPTGIDAAQPGLGAELVGSGLSAGVDRQICGPKFSVIAVATDDIQANGRACPTRAVKCVHADPRVALTACGADSILGLPHTHATANVLESNNIVMRRFPQNNRRATFCLSWIAAMEEKRR